MSYSLVSLVRPMAIACTLGVSAMIAAPDAAAAQAFPATLVGQAILPAASFTKPPADAPASMAVSGRYTHPDTRRRDQIGSIPGISFLSDPKAPRFTGVDTPFKGQPIQGFSGIKWMKDGTAWVTGDNGFGTRANSPDAMLMFYHVRFDWKTHQIVILRTVFLHDPDGVLPFNIVNSASKTRYLTGADLDIESIQIIGDNFWFGDELGPYLIRTDRNGKVTGMFETVIDGRVVRSPDHFAVTTPNVPGQFNTVVRRSRGFEGMAASPDGRFLYPLLEGPIWNEATKGWEMADGREALRILEFDVQKAAYTGRSWRYQLEVNGHNIGDFNMIDGTTALIIERDNREGITELACNGPARADCYNAPAQFKRVYKIDLGGTAPDGIVRKIGYIDLLNIADPDKRARQGTIAGRFTMPFWCIENVDIVDADHIIVGNDNNLTVGAGREPGKHEDNEFVLLRVSEFLRAL
jgi:hypothetical protein